jgi:hypothetical protein
MVNHARAAISVPGYSSWEVIMRSCLLVAALLVLTASSWAEDIRTPDPALSPAEVVEIQLTALQANDAPQTDAGIAQIWVFAHPDNKRMTGPLPRFAQMIKGPLLSDVGSGRRRFRIP